MRNYLLLLAAVGSLCCSCTSMKPNARVNYVPPSTSRVSDSVSAARGHANTTSTSLAAAAAKAKTATERIVLIETAVAESPPILTLAQQVHGDLDDLTKLLLDSNNSNDALKAELTNTDSQIVVLQGWVKEQTDLLNTANMERNQAITQGAIDKRNAHRFKGFIIALASFAAVAIMFGLFKYAAFAPPLLWVTLGAPAAVGTALFFWLG